MLEQQTRAANGSAFDAIINSTVRQQYASPRLVTFGAVRDLTAGGSAGPLELGAPGRGKHLTRLG